VEDSQTTNADDLESIPTDEGQESQVHATSESTDKKAGSGTEVSSQHNEPKNAQQAIFPQANGGGRVNSMPPRYEDIEHNAEKSQLQAEKFVDGDGRTQGPPTFGLGALQHRAKMHRKRMELIPRLRDKRSRIVGLRLRLHELRVSLRQERYSLSVRDAQWVQEMRFTFVGNKAPALDHLSEFERLQELRNSLQPQEDDYDRLEDQLNREEYELGELESKLYPLNVGAQISTLADDELANFDRRFEPTDSSLSTHSGPIETSSQVNRYLTRKGDVHLLQERLDELRIERAQIVDEELVRARVGRSLDDYSRAFLLEFDNRHSELQRELAAAEDDVAKLRMALIDRDDFIISADQFDEVQPEKSDLNSLDVTARNSLLTTDEVLSSSEYDPTEQEPLLLSGTEEPGPVFSESAIQGTKSVDNKASYINQWLLHRMRRSLREVRRFKSTLELKNLNLDQSRLTDLVLESWFKDGSDVTFARARKMAAESRNLSIQTTQGLLGPRETKSESFASGLQETVAQAPKDRGATTQPSGNALAIQPFTILFPRVAHNPF
jgi:hypothetical protein